MLDYLDGRAATARRLPATTQLVDKAQEATLAAWLIDAPGQSPAWSHYLVSVIHLRDLPGVPPAVIRVTGATHELLIAALDEGRHPTLDDLQTLVPLTPLNAQVQFSATDELAIHICEASALAICNGHMPAEPPFPGQGQRAWEQAVTKTLEHHSDGGHV